MDWDEFCKRAARRDKVRRRRDRVQGGAMLAVLWVLTLLWFATAR